MKKYLMGAAIALSMMTGGAQAAIFGIAVEGGGTAQIYQLGNGNLLGLLGFDTRNAAQTGGSVSEADITAAALSNSGSIQGYYFGTSSLNGGASEFDALTYPLTLANGTRYFDAIWVEWTGGGITWSNGRGGTTTLGTTVTRSGDPLAPIPLPATLALAMLGLGGLGLAARRQRRAADA